jgi:hypothetical protein
LRVGCRHQDDEYAEPSGSGDSSGWETEEGEEMDVDSAVAKARAAAEAITANSRKAAVKPSSKAKVGHMRAASHSTCQSLLHDAVTEIVSLKIDLLVIVGRCAAAS